MRTLFYLLTICAVSSAAAQQAIYKDLQTKLIEANNGDTLHLPAGTYKMPASLSLEGKEDIVIRGAGIDKTVISFKDQSTGAEGWKITNSARITLQDFTIQDAKGDCIKLQKVNGVKIRNVKAEWTGKPSSKNGGYGFYPVQCRDVLIEGSTAIGASDAGIYVGQCENIIVRNCKAHNNVAGIEIENSSYADVYNNESWENTGGVLVFNLPDLPVKRASGTRVFNNYVHDNNLSNFAPKGNIVATVPQGTGMIMLAAKEVEVFENRIENNRSVGIAIASYYITERPIKDAAYYPFSEDVYIHNNTISRRPERATMQGRLGKMFRFKLKFGKDVPNIIYDGIVDDKNKKQVFCLSDNKAETFANIDAANSFKNISRDVKPYQCKGKSLTPINLARL